MSGYDPGGAGGADNATRRALEQAAADRAAQEEARRQEEERQRQAAEAARVAAELAARQHAEAEAAARRDAANNDGVGFTAGDTTPPPAPASPDQGQNAYQGGEDYTPPPPAYTPPPPEYSPDQLGEGRQPAAQGYDPGQMGSGLATGAFDTAYTTDQIGHRGSGAGEGLLQDSYVATPVSEYSPNQLADAGKDDAGAWHDYGPTDSRKQTIPFYTDAQGQPAGPTYSPAQAGALVGPQAGAYDDPTPDYSGLRYDPQSPTGYYDPAARPAQPGEQITDPRRYQEAINAAYTQQRQAQDNAALGYQQALYQSDAQWNQDRQQGQQAADQQYERDVLHARQDGTPPQPTPDFGGSYEANLQAEAPYQMAQQQRDGALSGLTGMAQAIQSGSGASAYAKAHGYSMGDLAIAEEYANARTPEDRARVEQKWLRQRGMTAQAPLPDMSRQQPSNAFQSAMVALGLPFEAGLTVLNYGEWLLNNPQNVPFDQYRGNIAQASDYLTSSVSSIANTIAGLGANFGRWSDQAVQGNLQGLSPDVLARAEQAGQQMREQGDPLPSVVELYLWDRVGRGQHAAGEVVKDRVGQVADLYRPERPAPAPAYTPGVTGVDIPERPTPQVYVPANVPRETVSERPAPMAPLPDLPDPAVYGERVREGFARDRVASAARAVEAPAVGGRVRAEMPQERPAPPAPIREPSAPPEGPQKASQRVVSGEWQTPEERARYNAEQDAAAAREMGPSDPSADAKAAPRSYVVNGEALSKPEIDADRQMLAELGPQAQRRFDEAWAYFQEVNALPLGRGAKQVARQARYLHSWLLRLDELHPDLAEMPAGPRVTPSEGFKMGREGGRQTPTANRLVDRWLGGERTHAVGMRLQKALDKAGISEGPLDARIAEYERIRKNAPNAAGERIDAHQGLADQAEQVHMKLAWDDGKYREVMKKYGLDESLGQTENRRRFADAQDTLNKRLAALDDEIAAVRRDPARNAAQRRGVVGYLEQQKRPLEIELKALEKGYRKALMTFDEKRAELGLEGQSPRESQARTEALIERYADRMRELDGRVASLDRARKEMQRRPGENDGQAKARVKAADAAYWDAFNERADVERQLGNLQFMDARGREPARPQTERAGDAAHAGREEDHLQPAATDFQRPYSQGRAERQAVSDARPREELPLRRNGPAPPPREANLARFMEGSKAVDGQGRPQVLYHGSGAAFDTFKPGTVNAFGEGIYFTESPKAAADWAEHAVDRFGGDDQIYPVYLSIKRPYERTIIDETPMGDRLRDLSPAEQTALLKSEGYDGVVVHRDVWTGDRWQHEREFVAFEPNQIKSATGNTGAFDPANPSMMGAADAYLALHLGLGAAAGATEYALDDDPDQRRRAAKAIAVAFAAGGGLMLRSYIKRGLTGEDFRRYEATQKRLFGEADSLPGISPERAKTLLPSSRRDIVAHHVAAIVRDELSRGELDGLDLTLPIPRARAQRELSTLLTHKPGDIPALWKDDLVATQVSNFLAQHGAELAKRVTSMVPRGARDLGDVERMVAGQVDRYLLERGIIGKDPLLARIPSAPQRWVNRALTPIALAFNPAYHVANFLSGFPLRPLAMLDKAQGLPSWGRDMRREFKAALADPKSGVRYPLKTEGSGSKIAGFDAGERGFRPARAAMGVADKSDSFHKRAIYADGYSRYLKAYLRNQTGDFRYTFGGRTGAFLDHFAGVSIKLDMLPDDVKTWLTGQMNAEKVRVQTERWEASGKITAKQGELIRDQFRLGQLRAERQGVEAASAAMRDYGQRTWVDAALDAYSPWHFWTTRNLAMMARLAVKYPAAVPLVAAGVAAFAYENRDLPGWQKSSVHVPWEWVADRLDAIGKGDELRGYIKDTYGEGAELRFYPWQLVNPFAGMVADLFTPDQVSAFQGDQAAPAKVGAILEALGYTPNTLFTLGASLVQKAMGGPAPDKYPNTLRNAGKLARYAADRAGLGGVPKAANKAVYGQEYSAYDRRQIERQLAEWDRAGAITHRQAQDAIKAGSGPLWDQAERAYRKRDASNAAAGFVGLPTVLGDNTYSRDRAALNQEYQRDKAPGTRDARHEANAVYDTNPWLSDTAHGNQGPYMPYDTAYPGGDVLSGEAPPYRKTHATYQDDHPGQSYYQRMGALAAEYADLAQKEGPDAAQAEMERRGVWGDLSTYFSRGTDPEFNAVKNAYFAATDPAEKRRMVAEHPELQTFFNNTASRQHMDSQDRRDAAQQADRNANHAKVMAEYERRVRVDGQDAARQWLATSPEGRLAAGYYDGATWVPGWMQDKSDPAFDKAKRDFFDGIPFNVQKSLNLPMDPTQWNESQKNAYEAEVAAQRKAFLAANPSVQSFLNTATYGKLDAQDRRQQASDNRQRQRLDANYFSLPDPSDPNASAAEKRRRSNARKAALTSSYTGPNGERYRNAEGDYLDALYAAKDAGQGKQHEPLDITQKALTQNSLIFEQLGAPPDKSDKAAWDAYWQKATALGYQPKNAGGGLSRNAQIIRRLGPIPSKSDTAAWRAYWQRADALGYQSKSGGGASSSAAGKAPSKNAQIIRQLGPIPDKSDQAAWSAYWQKANSLGYQHPNGSGVSSATSTRRAAGPTASGARPASNPPSRSSAIPSSRPPLGRSTTTSASRSSGPSASAYWDAFGGGSPASAATPSTSSGKAPTPSPSGSKNAAIIAQLGPIPDKADSAAWSAYWTKAKGLGYQPKVIAPDDWKGQLGRAQADGTPEEWFALYDQLVAHGAAGKPTTGYARQAATALATQLTAQAKSYRGASRASGNQARRSALSAISFAKKYPDPMQQLQALLKALVPPGGAIRGALPPKHGSVEVKPGTVPVRRQLASKP